MDKLLIDGGNCDTEAVQAYSVGVNTSWKASTVLQWRFSCKSARNNQVKTETESRRELLFHLHTADQSWHEVGVRVRSLVSKSYRNGPTLGKERSFRSYSTISSSDAAHIIVNPTQIQIQTPSRSPNPEEAFILSPSVT